jgi:hypothetical protein
MTQGNFGGGPKEVSTKESISKDFFVIHGCWRGFHLGYLHEAPQHSPCIEYPSNNSMNLTCKGFLYHWGLAIPKASVYESTQVRMCCGTPKCQWLNATEVCLMWLLTDYAYRSHSRTETHGCSISACSYTIPKVDNMWYGNTYCFLKTYTTKTYAVCLLTFHWQKQVTWSQLIAKGTGKHNPTLH